MNQTFAEGMKLEDEVNGKTDPLALTKSCLEDITNSCISQDIAMVEINSGTVPALDSTGEAKVVSAKQILYQVCSVKHWKPPVYEWGSEDGPSNRIMFTCKVMVEIAVEEAESCTTLECFSNPMCKKKAAAEDAASGAVWYLKQLGCFPTESSSKKSRRKDNNKKLKIDGNYMS
ncbi:Endoribonuclease Dicer homolog 4 [Linum perenne]